MTIQEFNEILDFAVAREQEAVKFYHDLQQEVKFQAPVKARYFRFSALSEAQGRDYAAVAELDIIPVKK